MQEAQLDENILEIFEGYNAYWNSAEKRDILVQQFLLNKTFKCNLWNWKRRA